MEVFGYVINVYPPILRPPPTPFLPFPTIDERKKIEKRNSLRNHFTNHVFFFRRVSRNCSIVSTIHPSMKAMTTTIKTKAFVERKMKWFTQQLLIRWKAERKTSLQWKQGGYVIKRLVGFKGNGGYWNFTIEIEISSLFLQRNGSQVPSIHVLCPE